MPQANTPTETPAAALARKLARIEWLMADNLADWRPSFAALLERGTTIGRDFKKAA